MKNMKKKAEKVTKVLLAVGMAVSIGLGQCQILHANESATKKSEVDNKLENFAKGKKVTVSDQEAQFVAEKAVDGVVNRDVANKTEQSRWGTNQLNGQQYAWLEVDMGESKTFQSFVIAWERQNITGYQIQISNKGGAQADDWETVYTKVGDKEISDVVETIHLDQPKMAKYVRLLITGYNGKYVVGNPTADWKSVSLYEFQIYANEVPSNLLPTENYNLEGTATANNEEAGTEFKAKKAIDGIVNRDVVNKAEQSRWATEKSDSIEPRTLTVELPASQYVQSFRIFWERENIEEYTISVSNDGSQYQKVYTSKKAISEVDEIVNLDRAVWAKYIKLNITKYNGGSINWPSVSVYEFESYANVQHAENTEIQADDTAKEAAKKLKNAPIFNEEKTALVLPTVPEGFKVELLADFQEVIDRTGKIYQPLTEKTIKCIYKVTKGEETAESSNEFSLVIPGKFENSGENTKPIVVPELAEWHGETGNFEVNNNTRIVVDGSAQDIVMHAAKELQKDYALETGKTLEVVTGTPKDGDIFFTKDTASNLGKEGYVMDIQEHVTVKAEQATGAYWSTRTILQILKLNNNTMPKGITRDYPKYSVRGFSLDVARKPVSMNILKSIAKEMAYYKMNDFQIHLNDNLIFYEDYGSIQKAMEQAYTGFRLESDIKKGAVIEGDSKGIKNAADLTTKDLSYTKQEFRDFILNSRAMGLNIVPEFDAPGHSGAFMDVRPDLHLKQTTEGNANRAGEQFDLSEEHYADSVNFVKRVWDEYLQENMFDSSMIVHVGTDEYYGSSEAFRKFSDDIIKHVQETNKTVRMWGSLSHKKGTTPVTNKNVQMNCWYNPYAQPRDMYNQGYQLINTIDGDLYIVPSAGYYGDYLNTSKLYNNWKVNVIGGVEIPSASDQMLGSTFAIWNDSIDTRANGITEVDIYDRFIKAVPTLASKNWGDPNETSYNQLNQTVKKLGNAPGDNPYNEASSKDGKYMEYQFEEENTKKDASLNGRDLVDEKNVSIKNGELILSGDESYVTTPIEKLATGNTLEFDITLTRKPVSGEILFEADHPGNEEYSHDIRIMDDGTLGYTRELYDFSFGYTLPVGKTVHVSICNDGIKTYLVVDGEKYHAVGKYVDAEGRVKQTDIKGGIYLGKDNGGTGIATLLLPLQRIGSSKNAIDAKIDNVSVYEGSYIDQSIINSKDFVIQSDNQQEEIGKEGPIRFAFDNDLTTIWHSSYSPYKELPATFTVDMGKEYSINKLSYIPRTNGVNGNITEYSLFYKVSENDEWTLITENEKWASDGSEKNVKFDPVQARYIKFIAHHGMGDGQKEFASAAEFRIHKANEVKPENPTVDKAELQDLVNNASSYNEKEYTSVSYAKLKDAITKANAILTDKEASQEDVDAIKIVLLEAIKGLEKNPDLTPMDPSINIGDLKDAIDQKPVHDEKAYTSASWKVYQEALEKAKVTLAKEDANQEEIDAATKALQDAYNALEENPDLIPIEPSTPVDPEVKPDPEGNKLVNPNGEKPKPEILEHKTVDKTKSPNTGDATSALPLAGILASLALMIGLVQKKREE